MNKPALVVTQTLPEACETRIDADYSARRPQDGVAMEHDELVAAAAGVTALLITPRNRLDAETIARLPDSVRMLASFSVGFDHIDLDAARERRLIVTNTPDVTSQATAEIAILLMMAAARRAGEAERLLRRGAWRGLSPTGMLGAELAGRRLGILGMGRIGRAVARMAAAIGLTVHYHNRRPTAESGPAQYHDSLDSLLAVSDILSIHCPLTAETEGLIDAQRLAALPPGAILVNTARGPIVDDGAVIAALDSGHLRAIGLDVYSGEPAFDHRYLAYENAVLLPHIGSATVETRTAMGMRALDNLDAFFAGQKPADCLW